MMQLTPHDECIHKGHPKEHSDKNEPLNTRYKVTREDGEVFHVTTKRYRYLPIPLQGSTSCTKTLLSLLWKKLASAELELTSIWLELTASDKTRPAQNFGA